jgi:hypothetical protein
MLEYYEAKALQIFVKVDSKEMVKYINIISAFKINEQ